MAFWNKEHLWVQTFFAKQVIVIFQGVKKA